MTCRALLTAVFRSLKRRSSGFGVFQFFLGGLVMPQEWLKGVLKDAAESDAAAAAAAEAAAAAAAALAAEASKPSPPSPAAAGTPGSLSRSPAAALSAKTGGALFSHVEATRHLKTERCVLCKLCVFDIFFTYKSSAVLQTSNAV